MVLVIHLLEVLFFDRLGIMIVFAVDFTRSIDRHRLFVPYFLHHVGLLHERVHYLWTLFIRYLVFSFFDFLRTHHFEYRLYHLSFLWHLFHHFGLDSYLHSPSWVIFIVLKKYQFFFHYPFHYLYSLVRYSPLQAQSYLSDKMESLSILVDSSDERYNTDSDSNSYSRKPSKAPQKEILKASRRNYRQLTWCPTIPLHSVPSSPEDQWVFKILVDFTLFFKSDNILALDMILYNSTFILRIYKYLLLFLFCQMRIVLFFVILNERLLYSTWSLYYLFVAHLE